MSRLRNKWRAAIRNPRWWACVFSSFGGYYYRVNEMTNPTHNLRVLWASDHPDATSGYSIETKLTALHLKEHCHLALLATFGLHGSIQEWNGIPLFPGGADAFSNDVIAKAAAAWQADVVITLKDTQVFNPQALQGLRWCVPGHTLVTLANGQEVPIQEIVERGYKIKVKAWDGQKTIAADILEYQCIQTGMSGEIVEIEMEDGSELEITAENQILVLRNGVIDWIDAGCIIPGDMVYCNSSKPYVMRGKHGTKTGKIRKSIGANQRVPAAINDSGMGIYRWGIRWRGDNIDHPRGKTRSLVVAPPIIGSEHAQGVTGLVERENRYADQWPQSIGSDGAVHQCNQDIVDCSDTRVSRLSYPQEHDAVSYRQERASGNRYRFYGEPDTSAVQRAIHTGRDRFVAPCEGFEPRRVSRVQPRGRPYTVVYDLTTTAGNFVAGGILIHNCPMTPVDHDPPSPQVIERCRMAYRPIAYAPHGFRALRAAGLDPLYAPHAYDPAVYYPMDKAEARKLFQIPDDIFVVGTVAVNRGGQPSRKCWNENLEAFALFAKDKPNVRYFLHTDLADDGYEAGLPLGRKLARLGILDKVLYCDQARYRFPHTGGFPPEYMRAYYNALDVLNAVSMGEGFGIPALEAQACGIPVIVGNWCAHEDLCFSGWKVEKGEAHHFDDAQQDGGVFISRPEAIADRMERAYRQVSGGAGYVEVLSSSALAGTAPYQIDNVIRSHWLPLLAELTRDIHTPRSRGVLRIVRREEVFST